MALLNVSSMSRMAFSVAAFSIKRHPSSKLSLEHWVMVCSSIAWSWTLGASNVLKCCAIDCRKGSRHVTNAKLPAKLDTIKWAAAGIAERGPKECRKNVGKNVARMSERMSQECRKNVEKV
jgi:hypothetical protein